MTNVKRPKCIMYKTKIKDSKENLTFNPHLSDCYGQ